MNVSPFILPLIPASKMALYRIPMKLLPFILLLIPACVLAQPDTLMTYKQVEGDDLNLHVFYPPQPYENAPALVFYFGGGWNGGAPTQFYPHAEHFNTLGIVVINVEYRTKSSHGTSPFKSVEDAMSAMRWVRAHATDLGIDPNRIAAGGGSAGGHLAAATAMLESYDAPDEDHTISRIPNALVLFNPVVDNGPTGYGHERIGDAYPQFSPFHNVREGAPPMVILIGTNDNLIPVQTMVEFQQQVEAAGGRCDLHLYSGQPHGFFNYREGKNPYYDATVASVEEFLRQVGFIGR